MANYDAPFEAGMMARCELFLTPLFRKAQLKSRGDVAATRVRMLSYAERSAGVRLELVRRAIGKADFSAARSSAPIAPPRIDVRPFTSEQLLAMQARVQEAAERAIVDSDGDVAATRMAMWEAAQSDPELADAVAGLLILAQL